MDNANPEAAGLYDAAFYACAFAAASFVSCVVTLVRRDYDSPWDLFSVAMLGGVAGAILVGFFCWSAGATIGSEPGFMAAAALPGLFGRKLLEIIDMGFEATKKVIADRFQSKGGK